MSDLEIGLIATSLIFFVFTVCLLFVNHAATKLLDSMVLSMKRLEDSIEPLQKDLDFYRGVYLKAQQELSMVQIKPVGSQEELSLTEQEVLEREKRFNNLKDLLP